MHHEVSTSSTNEYLEFSPAILAAQEKHAATIRSLEMKRLARTMVAPTDDDDVRRALRARGRPVCLFGERPLDRRERLKLLLAEISLSSPSSLPETSAPTPEVQDEPSRPTLFYTKASVDLMAARRAIAASSWARASERLERERSIDPVETQQAVRDRLSSVGLQGSQVARRPLAAIAFHPRLARVVTGSFNGQIALWNSADLSLVENLPSESHEDNRITDVACSPQGALCGADAAGLLSLWRLRPESESLTLGGQLKGHVQRVARCAFDPSGRFIASTSFDSTWRLWDAETGTSLLTQDGHAREVYGLAFHPDGALVLVGDLGGAGRVWDVRSGKSVMSLQGHVLGVLSADFHLDGHTFATGGMDNYVRVWDLRHKKAVYMIPAHNRSVLRLKFAPTTGAYLATSSHDRKVKLWSYRDWSAMGTLSGHQGPVLGLDIDPRDETRVASSGYDRSWKAYGLAAWA